MFMLGDVAVHACSSTVECCKSQPIETPCNAAGQVHKVSSTISISSSISSSSSSSSSSSVHGVVYY